MASNDPTSLLAAAGDDFPTDRRCLQVFMFDRCTEWHNLLGLYRGILLQMAHHHAATSIASRQAMRQAVEQNRLLDWITEVYTNLYNGFRDSKGSDYWQWFDQHGREELSAKGDEPAAEGSLVRLVGLAKQSELNGALGRVARRGTDDPDTGRYAINLVGPPEAVAAKPHGIKVKPGNLEVLPAGSVAAVQLLGHDRIRTAVCHTVGVNTVGIHGLGLGAATTWQRCQVPELLGVPLMMLCLAPAAPKYDDESMATFLVVDPVSGFAPQHVQINGLGPVLVARSDGRDFTEADMLQLHAYMGHLMECWDDWGDDRGRRRALTPKAFRAFVRSRESGQQQG